MDRWMKIGRLALVFFAAGVLGSAASLTVPAGALISVRMTDALGSMTNHSGETFRAVVDAPVTVNGTVLVPKGAEAIGRVLSVESAGRFRGRSVIAVELTALNFAGKSIAVQTSEHHEAGASRSKQTAKIAGGATVLGTIVGAVAGAPFLGVGLGAATGMAVQSVHKPKELRIPAETLLLFTLQTPVPVEASY